MNDVQYSSENNLIIKRLSRNYKSGSNNSIILPNINTSLSINLSLEGKSGLSVNENKNKNLKQNISDNNIIKRKINLNPKIFKILNNSLLKSPNIKKIYNKKKLFGKLANNIAVKKMKNYFCDENDSFNMDENKNENIEKILKNTNKKQYYKQKSYIEKIIKKQKNLLLFNNNHYQSYNSSKNDIDNKERNLSGNNSTSNLSQDNNKIILDIKNINYKNPFFSLNSLINNKIIYKNILKNYKKNTIEGFENSIINMNTVLKYKIIQDHENENSIHPQKIKILPYIHKTANNYINLNENSDKLLLNKLVNSDSEKEEHFFGLNESNNNKLYLLKNYFQYPKIDFPESRAEFSFSQEGKEFILYGGFNSIKKSKIWKFNSDQKTWNQIETYGFKNDNRYGHTGVLRYRNLYIFGGKLVVGKILGDLEIFNLDTKMWSFPNSESNRKFDLRKNHIACGIGNHMFIHGGINEHDTYLNDCYLLSYKPLKWMIPDINKNINLPPIAYHSCCLVMQEKIRNNSNFNIYKSTEYIKEININENIKEKGLYIFGGKIFDGEKIKYNKTLYILKICKTPLEWMIPHVNGHSPSERYGCSMSYYERGNFIVIHGGKNDNILNDTFLLDLFYFNWIQVEYFNTIKDIPPRYSHQSIIDGNNLFIFGGTNDKNFLGSEMLIIELDSNWKCLKEKDEINYIRMIKNKKKNMIKYNFNLSKELKKRENKNKNKDKMGIDNEERIINERKKLKELIRQIK